MTYLTNAEQRDQWEFYQIQRFAAMCRRKWPGAAIVLWPNDGAPIDGAVDAPNNQHQTNGD